MVDGSREHASFSDRFVNATAWTKTVSMFGIFLRPLLLAYNL